MQKYYWLARDKGGLLFIYDRKPTRNLVTCEFTDHYGSSQVVDEINGYTCFITWEDSPRLIRLVSDKYKGNVRIKKVRYYLDISPFKVLHEEKESLLVS